MASMNIEWNKLESCGGHSNPELIPRAIELLFSNDAAERDKGYWGIDNHVVVQSDLYSSAPYAARLIVDRLLVEKQPTYEVVNILFELHNGSGPRELTVGPLAGNTLESICKSIIKETSAYLTSTIEELPDELTEEVKYLLEAMNEQSI